MHRLRLSSIVITFVLAFIMSFSMGCEDRKPRSVKGKGTDFTLKDLSGKEVSLHDFNGKVVMLEFWATWCPPCRAAIPELINLQNRFKDRGFALVSVSMDESKKAVKEFIDEYGINYVVLMDDDGVSDQFGVFSIPTSFIIDRNGTVVSKHAGYGEGMIDGIAEDIEELLDMPEKTEGAAPAEDRPMAEEVKPAEDGQSIPQGSSQR